MPVKITSFLVPSAPTIPYLMADTYLRGGLQVVADVLAMNTINAAARKAGMLVVTQDSGILWQLGADLLTFDIHMTNAATILGLATSATTDTTNASNITKGMLPISVIPSVLAGQTNFLGTWNATLNDPFITSGVGTLGSYYVVGVFGSTVIDTTGLWNAGDLIIFNGSVWERVASSSAVSSVAGQVGIVALTSADISGLAPSATIDTTDAANITTGILPISTIPIGDIEALIGGVTSVAGQTGVIYLTATDISGLAPSATTDTTDANNITSGVLSVTLLPISDISAALGAVLSVAGQTGDVVLSATDISGLAPSATIDTTNAVNITGLASSATIDTTVASNITGLAPSATIDTTNADNITSGTLPLSVIPASLQVVNLGIVTSVAGQIGDVTLSSTDINGLSASATTDTTNATNITSGTIAVGLLPMADIAVGVSGIIGVTTVAGKTGDIVLSASDISGLSSSATTDTTNATNITSGTIAVGLLPMADIAVGVSGIIGVTTVAGRTGDIVLSASDISGLSSSATTDTTNATNITSGTLAVGLLPITDIANSIGLVASATIDTTNASNITTGVLPLSVIPASLIGSVATVAGRTGDVVLTYVDIGGLALSSIIDTTDAANITKGVLPLSVIPASVIGTVNSVSGKTGIVDLVAGDISGLSRSATLDTTDATNITSGTLPLSVMPPSFIGSVSSVAGRTGDIVLSASDISGLSSSATTDTTNATNITSGTLAVGLLPITDIANSIGLAPSARIDTTDATNITTGTLPLSVLPTSVTNVVSSISGRTGAVALAASDISGLATSATLDTTDATNITTGTLPLSVLPTSVTNVVSSISGRTGAVALAASDISGLATSATVDATNASNITTGTLPLSVMPLSVTNVVSSISGRTGAVALAASDISGLAASATVDATNASNITTGTLPTSVLPVALIQFMTAQGLI
jgi:trimeric autotransporter adhesin